MSFTHRNLKEDLEDLGSNFDGAPDLEFRLATEALEPWRRRRSSSSARPSARVPGSVVDRRLVGAAPSRE